MNTRPSASFAARMGWGCILQLVSIAALAAVNHHLLTRSIENPQLRLGFALVSGLFLSLGLASFWSLVRGHGRGDASRRALLRRAETGEPPPDRGPVVATGIVRGLSPPLTSPLSGVPCAAYTYRMYRLTRQSDGDRIETPVYWGYASRPFALDGPVGRMRVLAVPRIVTKPQNLAGPAAIERARALVKGARFEEVGWEVFGVIGTAFTTVKEAFTDEDGEARRDWRRSGDETDPSTLLLEEAVLPIGRQASVHGIWSADRAAVEPGDDASKALGVSAALGPPEQLGEALPSSTLSYFLTALICTLLGAGIVWFGLEILPHLV